MFHTINMALLLSSVCLTIHRAYSLHLHISVCPLYSLHQSMYCFTLVLTFSPMPFSVQLQTIRFENAFLTECLFHPCLNYSVQVIYQKWEFKDDVRLDIFMYLNIFEDLIPCCVPFPFLVIILRPRSQNSICNETTLRKTQRKSNFGVFWFKCI